MSEAATPLGDPPVPKPVGDASYAFPAFVVGVYLPSVDDIPDRFHDRRDPWVELVGHWFFNGVPEDAAFYPKPGIDSKLAFRHVDACMRSYQPKHQHKEAGCAYLLATFFEKVVFPSAKILCQDKP